MALIVQYSPTDPTVPGRVTAVVPSANTPDYQGQTDTLINPDTSGVGALAQKYWKSDGTSLLPMTSAEQSALDAAQAAHQLAAARTAQQRDYDQQILFKALVDATTDGMNAERNAINQNVTAINALFVKAGVNQTLNPMNPLTYDQVRTAILNKIDALTPGSTSG